MRREEKKMQKIKQRMKNLSIRTALTILLLPFFLLLLICCISFYISGVTHYTSMVKENAESLIVQSRNYLNSDIEDIQDLTENLLGDHIFYNMKENVRMDKEPITPINYLQLSNGFTSFLQHYSTQMESIGLWLSDNSIYYYQSNEGNMISIMRDLDYQHLLKEDNELQWVSISEILPEELADKVPYHFALLQTIGTGTSKVSGVFLTGIHDEVIFNQIQNSRPTPNSEMVLMRKNGEIIGSDLEKKDENGGKERIIKCLGETEKNKILKEITETKKREVQSFDIDGYHIIYTPIEMKDTGILAVIPEEELYIKAKEFTYIFVFLAFIVLVLFVILYFVIPRYFSEPVQRLLMQMKLIREPADRQRIDVDGYQEIRQIGSGINEMMDRIHTLTESVQTELKAKQATQLQYLFAQINPHFLYNALDCIKELCACQENEKAGEMIDQLAVFYRIGVSKGKSFITLEEEIRHVSAYLSILQTRFEDFRFTVHIQEELKKAVILRMVLQPIVENAVYHGIRPYRTDGTVQIIAEQKEERVEIHVKDDGGGVAEDVLKKVRHSLNAPICEYTEQSYGVYGLKNVQDRIQIAYGREYKIRIETEIDCGTDVILTIPFEEEHK